MAGADMKQPDGSVIQFTASAPVEGVSQVIVGTPVAPGRALVANCTVAGNMTVQFYDGSQSTYPLVVGLNVLPFAVTEVLSTTATSTFEIWK